MSSRQTVCVRKAAEREGAYLHYLQLESPCSKSQELGAVLLLHGSEQKPQTEANVVPLAVEVAGLLYQALCTQKPKSYHAANRKVAPRAPAADSHWNSSTASPFPSHLLSQIIHYSCNIIRISFREHHSAKALKSAQLHCTPQFSNWLFSCSSEHNTMHYNSIKATSLGYRLEQNSRVPTLPSAAKH